MRFEPAQLPDNPALLKAMLIAEQAARIASEHRATAAETRTKDLDAEIENLKLTIAKMKADKFGPSSEKGARLIDQLELQLGELIEKVAAHDAAAEITAPAPSPDSPETPPRTRRKPVRGPLPAHLPRERVVHPAPAACPCCQGDRFRKLGEDTTETLDRVPASWKVVVHVRERLACRTCDTMVQTPAPSHPISRGRAGPNLLADILFSKYAAHLPLNRQSDIFAAEGVNLDLSTLADWVGACAATLMPLRDRIEKHVLAAERIHADDTLPSRLAAEATSQGVPVFAKNKCTTGRLWTYVRDDRPFGGPAAPAALYHYSADREARHPEAHLAAYAGLMQADAYSGYNGLYAEGRKPGRIFEAACWAHGRRKFYELADLRKSPIAIAAVRRIDALFAIETAINGKPPDQRLAARQHHSKPLVDDLERWLKAERQKLSSKNPLAKAIDYSLKRWPAFTRFLTDGRLCLSNNAAERAVRGIAVGRRNWTFCGSCSGGHRAAVIYTLIETAKLNAVDPRAWLADVLVRIADHPASRISELLPWEWKAKCDAVTKAAA